MDFSSGKVAYFVFQSEEGWARDLKNKNIFIFADEEERYLKWLLFAINFYVYALRVQVHPYFIKVAEANLNTYI